MVTNICKYLQPPGSCTVKLEKLNKRRGQIDLEIRDNINEEAMKKWEEDSNPGPFHNWPPNMTPRPRDPLSRKDKSVPMIVAVHLV